MNKPLPYQQHTQFHLSSLFLYIPQVERKEKSATESEGLQDDPAKALSVNEKNLLPVPLVTVSHCIETCTTAGSKTVPTTMINTKISPTSSASHKSCVIIDLTVPEFDDAATSASENTLSLEKISAANSGKNVAVSACVSNGDIKHIDLDKIFNCPSFQEVWKDKDFYKDTLLTATKVRSHTVNGFWNACNYMFYHR